MSVRTLKALACACLSLSALPALAQSSFQRPGDAIEYRQSAFTVIEVHFKRINAMANGKLPFDAKQVADNAAIVSTLARLPFTAFGEGTDKAPAGLHTHAKPAVWSESAKFKDAADKFLSEVGKLDAAAKTGQQDQIKVAAGAVGQSCKACHENFKNRD